MDTKDIVIIDNFLPPSHIEELSNFILGSNSSELSGSLPLYYAGGSVPLISKGNFSSLYDKFPLDYSKPCPHLSHVFFYENQEHSEYYKSMILPIINIIKPTAVERVKLNITLQSESNIASGWHIDSQNPQVTTALFYLTSHLEGGTMFEDGRVIKAKANRFVSFPSCTAHTGIVATSIDEKVRVVLNFNYIKT